MNVVLISTYELGRQPFGLASPAAWLRQAGHSVRLLDLSRQPLDTGELVAAGLVAFYLPMHTATRLALPIIDRVRDMNPDAHLCAYGLYARPNAALLSSRGIRTVLGGEFEHDLVKLANGESASVSPDELAGPATIPRLSFLTPSREDLPPLSAYAALVLPNGHRRSVGYTEASRGCKHLCRHCPVVPIYNGRFRIVRADVVLSDIRAQVARGAQHITFGDPDFFNGIGHATRIVQSLAREWPHLTYDVTIKIEHLLQHANYLPTLKATGCLFITSAVESVDDSVLKILEKGHTRDDFVRAAAICRREGLTLSPTFVAFTPWTTLDTYRELLRTVDELNLVHHVAPIQLAIKLLLPNGSRLLELAHVRELVGPFDSENLVFPWAHPDPEVDALQRAVARLVSARAGAPRPDTFREIWNLAHHGFPDRDPASLALSANTEAVPYVDEPWYCCAEPLPLGEEFV